MMATRDDIKKRLFTVKEAATYLGRTPHAIRELQWDGLLPAVKVGRRIHFDVLDLDKFVEKFKIREIY
jgi:excisionase family DNA binding protein